MVMEMHILPPLTVRVKQSCYSYSKLLLMLFTPINWRSVETNALSLDQQPGRYHYVAPPPLS